MRYQNHIIHYCFLSVLLLLLPHIIAVHGTSPDAIRARLERAREDLRISQATEARAVAEFTRLQQSGQASPAVLRDYEIYLQRVRALRAENRKIVHEMEAAYARLVSPAHPPTPATVPDGATRPDVRPPDEHAFDKLGALEREFIASLATFDEMLLQELEKIRAQSSSKRRDLATEAAAAAKRLRQQGVDVDSTAPSTSDTSQKSTDAQDGTRDEAETSQEAKTVRDGKVLPEHPSGAQKHAKGQDEEDGATSTQRKSVLDSSDDDIVARQLREAAEQETNPVLKEKLWQEYEDYKRGNRR